MALHVNPTRMELNRLKKRLHTARRGHKLLKDKQSELVRQFMKNIRVNKQMREEVEHALAKTMHQFSIAEAHMGKESLREALLIPAHSVDVSISEEKIINVTVPKINMKEEEREFDVPYGLLFSSFQLDEAVIEMTEIYPKLLHLAEVEKACDMLADEIEKTRRRVNALEHVMIPQMEESIAVISAKLEDNERASIIRLLKVKELVVEEKS